MTFKPQILEPKGDQIVGLFKLEEPALREIIHKKTSIKPMSGSDKPNEVNLKRAEFFAKTILNAKKVAQYYFSEEVNKHASIRKDPTPDLIKLMNVRNDK